MTVSFNHSYRVVLLDIEGTTTPVDFVYQILFPYARKRLADYLAQHFSSPEVRVALKQLREENVQDAKHKLNPPLLSNAAPEAEWQTAIVYLHWLMDADRKSTPLKTLQGLIWEAGYNAGELHSEVFADVPQAFLRWCSQRQRLAIFSSGSVRAQQLLFAHTAVGDLSKFISAYFDTNIGAKREAASYRRIADALQQSTNEIIFLSDIVAELDAAQTAGMQTALCLRPGNAPQPAALHSIIHTFDEMFQ
ncbi:MAG: acireductone synthase [Acidobacteria bacterium]|nr:acireductone synthase [Acidobacteriota bacterium]